MQNIPGHLRRIIRKAKVDHRNLSARWRSCKQPMMSSKQSPPCPKNLWTTKWAREEIVYYRANDGRMKLSLLLKRLKLSREAGYKPRDFAVLYRTNAPVTDHWSATQVNIPYTMVGAPSSTAERKFRDVVAYLNLIANLSDNISFESALSMNPSRESGQVQWIRFTTLPKCKVLS